MEKIMNFLNYPEVEIARRNINKEIELIWTGFRTCYSNKVNYADMYPFKLDFSTTELREKAYSIIKDIKNFYVTELCKTLGELRKISKKYNYSVPGYIEHFTQENLELFFDSEVSSLEKAISEGTVCLSEKAKEGYEFLRSILACKWVYPKLRIGHGSPLEHGVISFKVKNASRSLTHQLVRHRVASYSQSSQRYISEDPDNLEFVIPKEIQDNKEALKIVEEYLENLSSSIKKLKELKVRNEDIRCIYPNAITTDIQVTMNFRELRHFISLRLSKHAQDEIRKVAFDLLCYMCLRVPFVFADLTEVE